MKTVCLSCIVYTLNGKDPKDNLYLNIFHQWLSMLIKNGGLQPDDLLIINIDTITLEYFNKSGNVLRSLLQKLECPFVFYTFDPPNTPLEGMMHKYDNTEYTQDIYIYSDIDVLIVKPLSLLREKVEGNTMYIVTGRSLDHQFYSEGFPPEFPVSKDLPGYNASIFLFSSTELRNSFFAKIHELCDYSTQYKWVEQPYFNRAIYHLPRDTSLLNTKLLSEHVSFNDYPDTEKIIFLDLAGETSNGLSHFTTMSDMICLFIAGGL